MAPSGPTTSPTIEPTTKEFLEAKPVSERLNFISTMTISTVSDFFFMLSTCKTNNGFSLAQLLIHPLRMQALQLQLQTQPSKKPAAHEVHFLVMSYLP